MRVKRIEKEINRTIIEANQVPDFVLDKARREIQNSTPTIYVQNGCYKHKFKPITIAMACIAILLIVITSITLALNSDSRGPNDNVTNGVKEPVGDSGPGITIEKITCHYNDLTKQEYSSIDDIVNEYHIPVRSIRYLDVINTALFLLDGKPVLVEENYYFKGKLLNYKIVNYQYTVIFNEELSFSEPNYIGSLPYYVARKDDMVYLKTKSGGNVYYLSCQYYDNYKEIIDYFWENF